MEPHAKYTLVGTVVILLIGLTVFSLLWLARSGKDGEHRTYVVFFKRQSLAGLQDDSSVTMRGIRVGSVESLEIAAPDIELVRVLLKIEAETPVKTNTRAVVVRNLLTGLAYIDLIGSTSDSPYLVRRKGDDYPVIPEGESQLEAIANDLPRLVAQLNGAVNSLSGFLTDENRAAFSGILRNIETISARFAEDDSALTGLAHDLAALSRSLRTFTDRLDTRTEEIVRSLTTTSTVVADESRNLSRDVSRAARSVVTTLERYKDPVALLAGPPPQALGPGEEGTR